MTIIKDQKGGVEIMAIKKSVWNIILKAIIAVASAMLGALGGNAMNL